MEGGAYAMLQRQRIIRAFAIAALLLSSVSGSAFAAKAQDPDDNGWVCFVIVGMVWCVPSR
jgi:hypothetical protein